MIKIDKKLIILFVCSLLASISLIVIQEKPALSHRPHDVVSQVEISSNYQKDQTVFIIVRDNIFKSQDGGVTWQRLSKGLDNHFYFTSLVLSPQQPNLLFSSTFGDGIYQSIDGGNNWQKVNNGLKDLKIQLLAIASNDQKQLLLAAPTEKGLYQSENQGQSWQEISQFKGITVSAIAFSPEVPNLIIIGDQKGNIYQSLDRGKNWQKTSSIKDTGAINTIAISPNFSKDQTYLVGTEKQGIFKTQDQGKTFTAVNQGLTDQYIIDLVVDPSNKQQPLIYASTWQEGALVSQDLGNSWTKITEGIVKDHQAEDLKQSNFYDLEIVSGAEANKTLFLGSFNGLFVTKNNGQQWQEIESLSLGTITSLAISPNYEKDGTLAIVTYVGYPYLSSDQGVTWQVLHQGIEIPRFTGDSEEPGQDPRRFFDVAFSPNYASDRTIFASLLWTKIVRSDNEGKSWKIIELPKEVRGINIVPSPNFAQDQTVYLGCQQGVIFKSTNGGKKFEIIGQIPKISGNDSPSMVISPNFASDQTLYAASSEGIYQSIDGGDFWQPLTSNQIFKGKNNLQLVISPNYQNDQTLLLGTNQGLLITKDGGKTWQEITTDPDRKTGYIEGVAISPNYQQDRTFLISIRGQGLFKTVDDGQTFSSIGDHSITFSKMNSVPSAGIPIHFSPNYTNDQTIYGFGAASTVVYKSTDAGNSWQAIDIPRVQNVEYGLLTAIDIWLNVNRSKILRVIIAFVAAGISFVVFGFLGLEKKLPLAKLFIQLIGALAVFGILILIFMI